MRGICGAEVKRGTRQSALDLQEHLSRQNVWWSQSQGLSEVSSRKLKSDSTDPAHSEDPIPKTQVMISVSAASGITETSPKAQFFWHK